MITNVFVCVSQVVVTSSYGDYSSYMHAVSQYYSQTQMSQTAAQVYQHRDVSKVLYTHTHTHWYTSCLIMLTLQCTLTISVHLKTPHWKRIMLCRNTKQLTLPKHHPLSGGSEYSSHHTSDRCQESQIPGLLLCLEADTTSLWWSLCDLLIVRTVTDQNRSEIRLWFLCRHIQYAKCAFSNTKIYTDCMISLHITACILNQNVCKIKLKQ